MLWVRWTAGPAFVQPLRKASVHFAAERTEPIPVLETVPQLCLHWVDQIMWFVYEITSHVYPASSSSEIQWPSDARDSPATEIIALIQTPQIHLLPRETKCDLRACQCVKNGTISQKWDNSVLLCQNEKKLLSWVLCFPPNPQRQPSLDKGGLPTFGPIQEMNWEILRSLIKEHHSNTSGFKKINKSVDECIQFFLSVSTKLNFSSGGKVFDCLLCLKLLNIWIYHFIFSWVSRGWSSVPSVSKHFSLRAR